MEQSSDIHSLPSAPFDRLATETIAQIFNSTCPDVNLPVLRRGVSKVHRSLDSPITDPWVLSEVCKRWKNITTSYHSLWTTIIIESVRVDRREWIRWGLSQLRDCLSRSGSQPLKIRITGGQYNDAVIIEILDVVQAYSEQWKSIAFVFPLSREFIKRFDSLEGRLPMLEHLDIHLSSFRFDIGTPSICTAFLTAPALSHIGLSPFFGMTILHNIQIPWKQISEITFGNNDFHCRRDLYEILTHLSSSLTALTFSNTLNTSADLEIWSQVKPIKLAKLRQLYFFQDCTGILDVLVCPSLFELHIEIGRGLEIIRFLDDSSCSLKHTHLGYIFAQDPYDDLDYSAMVLKNASLSALQSISLTILTDEICDLLIFGTRHLLPSLETLRVCSTLAQHGSGPRHLESQVNAIRNIVQSRTYTIPSDDRTRKVGQCLKNCSFSFTLEGGDSGMNDCWDTTQLEALRLFCIARNTRVLLDIIYSWNHYSPTDDEYDSTDDDARY